MPSEEVRSELKDIFRVYKEVFPVDLPSAVPPPRPFDDKLYITLEEGT